MMRTVNKCPECGSSYEPSNSNQIYCSRPCRRRSNHDSHQKPVPCAGCGEEFIRRRGKSSKFCSLDCGVNYRSRSDHACQECGTPQTPVDTEKYGCIIRTWRCGRCDQLPGGTGNEPVPDITKMQVECGTSAEGHAFACPAHPDGINCIMCAWECTICGVPMPDWFKYKRSKPDAVEAGN